MQQLHERSSDDVAAVPLHLRRRWRGLDAPPLVGLQRGRFKLSPELERKLIPAAIRCPHCRWQPRRSSRWYCLPCGHPENFSGGCGTAWNTFETRGRCPGCAHQWTNTSCLACGQWSLHKDWYVTDPDDRPQR